MHRQNVQEAIAAMQETRRYILEILKEQGQATVDDIVAELQKRRGAITAVTVRHHLNRLHDENLITAPELRRRTTPGRPQHVYTLTEKARDFFPDNYQPLATALIEELSTQLPPSTINVILEGTATRMAQEAGIKAESIQQRLDKVVDYLNIHGYEASWKPHEEGYTLETSNCPYHQIDNPQHMLCEMDMRFVASLLGIVPRILSRSSEGADRCAYLIPVRQTR
ncbi:MAG: ArsR family transcriptional regulator [Anaerolineaceae bacterium]|nr:ArsR family transcriptional regulator [Anaerolineaceae bacterium]